MPDPTKLFEKRRFQKGLAWTVVLACAAGLSFSHWPTSRTVLEMKTREKPATETEKAPRRVLFVCVENSCRSQIAEAFARMHGGGRVEAYSAGSRPSGRVNPKAVDCMRSRDYDLDTHRSKSLAEIPDLEYDAAVTMGCGDVCPQIRARLREDWNIPDPKELPAEEFGKVRDAIEVRVKELLEKL